MDFKTKIDKILKAKGIARWKLAQIAGINTTIEKAYQENREMREGTTLKLIQNLNISPDWWYKGEGPIFLDTNVLVKLNNVTRPAEDWHSLHTTIATQRELLKDALENVKTLTGIVERLTLRLEAAEKERNYLAHGITPPKEKNAGQQ